jgi:hypothetical protein
MDIHQRQISDSFTRLLDNDYPLFKIAIQPTIEQQMVNASVFVRI